MNLLLGWIQAAATEAATAAEPDPAKALQQTATAFFAVAGGLTLWLATVIAIGGLLVIAVVVAPDVTTRCTDALRRRNIISLGAGAGVFFLMALLGAGMTKIPLLALVWLVLATFLSVVGIASASEDLGRRVFWLVGREGNRVLHVLVGWVSLAAAAAVPVLGWFVIGPYLFLSGLGSCVVSPFLKPAPGRETPDVEIR